MQFEVLATKFVGALAAIRDGGGLWALFGKGVLKVVERLKDRVDHLESEKVARLEERLDRMDQECIGPVLNTKVTTLIEQANENERELTAQGKEAAGQTRVVGELGNHLDKLHTAFSEYKDRHQERHERERQHHGS